MSITQYRINNETFQFYKNVNSLLSAQGKIFDPIAFQFQGNMSCKTNSQKLVLGFFEASSVKRMYVNIKPGTVTVNPMQSYDLPSAYGCVSGISSETMPSVFPPDFWVY